MSEECKTLEAYLAPPTQHKQRKLHGEHDRYESLLRRSFNGECDTMTAVNEIVTGEDLNWHSKNALKKYVPNLLDEDTYDAKQLADDHPIRYANTAAVFDHDDDRHHEICWEVPLPGHGTNFWIPLQLNPEQEEWWHSLIDDEDDSVWAGEIRLQLDGDRWVLHVTANYEVESDHSCSYDSDDVTPVGFDVGESKLLVGCALRGDTPVDPLFVDGGRVRHLRQKQASAEDRLKPRYASKLLDDLVWGRWQDAIEDEVEKASHRAVEYASQFENPVIALEYLDGITNEDIGEYWNRRLGKWLFSQIQSRIEDKAAERGIPVECVHPHHTSKTCHACQHVGYRPHQGTFKCTNEACWVLEYQADLNAAANIANRLNPWGESLPWKTVGDDSPQSGGQWQAHEDTSPSEGLPSEKRASDDKGSSSSPVVGAGARPETGDANTS
ncbi:zinc ribbon domain-containing protein [Halorubrum sp. PV6]|uniref:zinc ribbon domain-containing protein n=1 Tax=Halorubrum sp. PV6 TaxID=634157 RepID=UPI0011988546|nr:zinc ribbon domain-containing protein [Halorubrum sp. PV6]AZQ16053.1 transposase [Halorubrum sp. PV6]